jgi:hypothetical protein
MICPNCKAEYREGFTECADCKIPLTATDTSGFDADSEDPFCKFWEGNDVRICVDLCSILDEADIPHRVLRQEAHLFRFSASSHMRIGVPFSLFEKAEAIVAEAFAGADHPGKLLNSPE